MSRTTGGKRSKSRRYRQRRFVQSPGGSTGPVTITHPDGTTEVRPALNESELQALVHDRDVSAGMRARVTARDGRCRYCGTEVGPFAVDHVVPIALGGSNRIGNLVLACVECNTRKGIKLWTVRFGPLPRKHRQLL